MNPDLQLATQGQFKMKSMNLDHIRTAVTRKFCVSKSILACAVILVYGVSCASADETLKLSLLMSSKANDVNLKSRKTAAAINGCTLNITYTYVEQCEIISKVKSVSQSVDLRSVGDVNQRLFRDVYIISLEPKDFFWFRVPGASVRSQSVYTHCGSLTAPPTADTDVSIIVPTNGRASLGRDLKSYILKNCGR